MSPLVQIVTYIRVVFGNSKIHASIEILQWILDVIKLRWIQSEKNHNPKNNQDTYTYIVRYNDGIELLSQIEPYFIIPSKKQRAKMILT